MNTNRPTEQWLLGLQKRGMEVIDPVMDKKLKKAFGMPLNNKWYGKEDDFQITLMRDLRSSYPDLLIVHTPNGGNRSKAEAGRFKAMGVVAGMPDILIFDAKIFLELKVAPNKPTDKQLVIIGKLKSIGWTGDVFYGIDEALEFVKKILTK